MAARAQILFFVPKDYNKDYNVVERQGLGGRAMSKDVIHVGGEDVVVREDTAKSYRGTIWALGSLGIFIVVAALIFFFFFLKAATDDKPAASPANVERNTR